MRKLLASASAAPLMMAAIASAQTASPSTPAQGADTDVATNPQPNPSVEGEAGLADIVVTAQRTQETLQRAAVAVDVIQGGQLASAGVFDVTTLSQLSPALTIEPSSTGNLIFLRGVGNFTLVPTSDPAIAFNYDGVYIGRPTSTSTAFFDLERIEVLKGPQGTLYGRNATGGAINILPAKPKPGEFSGYVTASYANYDSFVAEGAINLPMGDNGAARISASRINRDGYLRDGTSDDESWALRAQVFAELTPDFDIRLAADYSDQGGIGVGATYQGQYQYFGPAVGYRFIPSGLDNAEGFYTPAAQTFRQTAPAPPAGRLNTALAPYPFRDNHFFGTNAEINWKTGIGTLTVIPAYRQSKLNYLADAAAFIARDRETDDQYSIEARLSGKGIGIFDYTIGAFYYDESISVRQGIYISALAAILTDKLTTKSFAPFARLTANLSDRLRVTGGIRHTRDRKTFSERGASGTIVCTIASPTGLGCPTAPLFPYVDSFDQLAFPFPPAGAVPPIRPIGGGAIVQRSDRVQDNRLINSKTTWRAAAEFDLAPRSLLYASVETGFRSGGFSGARGFETYDPETITAYTVGSKNRFVDNRLQLNVEAFWWTYKDQQVNFVGLDAAGNTANQTRNIGRSRIRGVDVETRFLLTPTTLLGAQVQYLDARNRSFVYQTSNAPLPPLTGCAVGVVTGTIVNVDCSGFRAYNSPKWTVDLSAQQTFRLGDFKLIFGGDTQYRTSRYIAFSYLPESREPDRWRSNAQVTLADAADRFSISGFVNNIENKRTPVFSSVSPLTSYLIATTTAPRTYGVRGSVRF